MEKHTSKPFNPNIAHVLYLAGCIDSWGRGIEIICDVYKAEGVPEPEYTVHPGDIMIKFTAPEDRVVRRHIDRVTERVTERVTVKVTEEKEIKLIQLLLEDPAYTYIELEEKLGVSRKTISKLLKSLKDKQVIMRIGSGKKGYWQSGGNKL